MNNSIYKYEVISSCIELSCYIIDILKIHGLCYEWIPSIRNLPESTTIIKVSENEKKIFCELFFSTNLDSDCFCEEIEVQSEVQLDWYKLFYNDIECLEFPTWHNCIYSLRIKDNKNHIKPICYISNKQNHYCVGAHDESKNKFFISINISKYLEYSLLGLNSLNNMEDWSEINGYFKSHKNATNTFIDNLFVLIRYIIMSNCEEATPIYIDYYPVNESAPLIITGDSDESTFDQITRYFNKIEKYNHKSCLLIKESELFNELLLTKDKYQAHCFGIHPFSQKRELQEYSHKIQILYNQFRKSFGNDCTCALRNHVFQNIDARRELNMKRQLGIHFDMNSVLANNNSWIGTGSGVGIPIPFPPINGIYNIYPLHFTTFIEDDVFLFKYEYCYKPYQNDSYSTKNLIVKFLNQWLIKMNKPAQVNLHPQNPKKFLNLIIQWSIQNKIWNPNLNEYHQWLLERNSIIIEVINKNKYKLITKSNRITVKSL